MPRTVSSIAAIRRGVNARDTSDRRMVWIGGSLKMIEPRSPRSVPMSSSTVRPETCLRLAAAAAERDITLIDAPVSGGAPAAEAGELLVMVGGDAETFERCKPVFSTYGNPVVHVGPLGSGQLAKLVNNVLFIAHLGIANDAYVLGEGLGLDRNALYAIVSRGSGNSFGLGLMSARTLPEMGALAGTLLRKDLDIVTEVAAERGADGGSLIDVANDAVERMEGE